MPLVDREELSRKYFGDDWSFDSEYDAILVKTNRQPSQPQPKLPFRSFSRSNQAVNSSNDDTEDETNDGIGASSNSSFTPTVLGEDSGCKDQLLTTARTESLNSEAEADFLYTQFHSHRDDTDEHQDWKELKLIDFCIYERGGDPVRPESLRNVTCHDNGEDPRYCFDGTLVHEDGSTQIVRGASVYKVSIGNLRDIQDDKPPETANTPIWLKTRNAVRYNCWYVLGTPNASYDASFRPFLWLAQFTKHIIDYLAWSSSKSHMVGLTDLKGNFLAQLIRWHKNNPTFQEWHAACGSISDFRQHLACANHASFIYGQAYDVADEDDDAVLSHPLWEEVGQPVETRKENEKAGLRRTTVTAHATECFLRTFPEWGRKKWNLLKVAVIEPIVQSWQAERRKALGLGRILSRDQPQSPLNISSILETATLKRPSPGRPKRSITAGKAILAAICDDRYGHECRSWPCPKAQYQFAYVRVADAGVLHILRLLTPAQTACAGRHAGRDPRKKASAFYPTANELFWDGESIEYTISPNNVIDIYDISTDSNHGQLGEGLFVHRTYYHRDCSFRTSEGRPSIARPPRERTPRADEPGKVKVLSLFCGSGIFDKGLESGSGGLLQTIFAADLNGEALKTFKANHLNTQACEFHHEDVNVLLNRFCLATDTAHLPDIDCLIAGCPCPGFSNLNPNKDNERSQKNCSLLAHTLSWVEILLPRMVVIENVPAMDACAETGTPPTAAGQAICFLVSLGYQVKIVTIKSSDYGGATNRNRIFIIATIPEIPLPVIPEPTHGEGLGQDAVMTVKAATADLEAIDNDTEINVLHPNHVPFERLTQFERLIVELVPRKVSSKKRMANLANAYQYMSATQKRWYSKLSDEQQGSGGNSFRRVHPNRPMQTITTRAVLLDARGCPKIHWLSDRVISLLEFRRGQGVPLDYILVGDKHSQMKQIGNSVAWATSAILGKAIAVSWRRVYPERFQGVLLRSTPRHNLSNISNRIKHKVDLNTKIDDFSDSDSTIDGEEDFVVVTSKDWQASPSLAFTPLVFLPSLPTSALLPRTPSTPSKSISLTSYKPTKPSTTGADTNVDTSPRTSLLEDASIPANVKINSPQLLSAEVPSPLPTKSTPVRPRILNKTVVQSAPTKSMSDIYRQFKERERLSVSPGGSLQIERKTTSKVTVRKRCSSPSDGEDDETADKDTIIVKRPRTNSVTDRTMSRIPTQLCSPLPNNDDRDDDEDKNSKRRRFDTAKGKPLVNVPRPSRTERLRRVGGNEPRSDLLGSKHGLFRYAPKYAVGAGESIETAIEVDD
ncbi:hypothetical protein H2198_003165 [Neophaeococcomyces mojaviensis]|uniref:Uncharacterized protein n=1 Tax=Neophaeococcomyces mojaviensis TaxID=3383035 RepID=A0ACC3ACQ3_9EURO|nr:hypothetical protein H2198_003165 [Knufia sp. JES_112]